MVQLVLLVDVCVSDSPKKNAVNTSINKKFFLANDLYYLGIFMQKFERQN